MEVFVKSFSSFRTIKHATAPTYSLVLDSLDGETSSITVTGNKINLSDVGNWLIANGIVYQISAVRPQQDRTVVTLIPALSALSRLLEYEDPSDAKTIGAFIERQLIKHWVQCPDMVYAIPYLVVSNLDTTAYCPPELDNNGCFSLADYSRLMRKSYRVDVQFSVGVDSLVCTIAKAPTSKHNVVFDDGRSQIKSVDFSSSGTAKITVLHDIRTEDEEGNEITTRDRSTWYLSADGTISTSVPTHRAAGSWSILAVSDTDADIEAKVREAFAKNKKNHKLEFYSERDLKILDDCNFLAYGDVIQSHISYKRIASGEQRIFYRSGELAVSATEKLRGVK